MARSLKKEFQLLDEQQQLAILDTLDPETLTEMAKGAWWWLSRPEQVPPPGSWTVHLFLGGRGTGKTRSGAEWLVQRAIDYPYDTSGFPAERLVMAYSLNDARMVCIEGSSGILRALENRGFEMITDPRYKDDPHLKYHYVRAPKPHIILLETGTKIFFTGADVDVARGFNLADVWCVAKGEPVATSRGLVPIEQIIPGDLVVTSDGWSEVTRAGLTKRQTQVIRISTDAGDVRVTPDHKVWANGGWVRADMVNVGDTMVACLDQVSQLLVKRQHSMNGMAKPGTTTSEPSITTAEMDFCYTGQCGLLHMDPSQMVTTFTTSTENGGTTDSSTSKYSPTQNTWQEHGLNAPTKTKQIPGEDPKGPAEDLKKCGPTGPTCLKHVHSADVHTIPLECELSCAAQTAAENMAVWQQNVNVISVVWETELTDVYDLTVSGAHEFHAGTGLIKIHNCDEVVKWSEPERIWREGILPALRTDLAGDKPRAFFTTTPKPIEILQNWLLKINNGDPYYSYARGTTFDNEDNLSEDFIAEIKSIYEGTTIGRQELYGEMLDGMEGMLFSFKAITDNRVTIGPDRVSHRCVGVDPGLTGEDDADEMGVVVVSRDFKDHMFVVADETRLMSGRDAALHAWQVFAQYQCDTLVYEENLGKAWMKQVFTDAFWELQKAGLFPRDMMSPPLVPVWSAHGKKLRAQPVAMRYSQGRVHHIGLFPELEKQMLGFDPVKTKESPDRLDALVHACTHLMEGERRPSKLISPVGRSIPSLSRMY